MGSQDATVKLILDNVNPPSHSSLCNPDFLLVLIESLNPLLKYPIEYTGDPTHDVHYLTKGLIDLAYELFLHTFKYPFNSNPLPRLLSKPSKPFSFGEFINCPISCPQLINGHILTRGLTLNNIPRPFTHKIAADLYTAMKDCLGTRPGRGWEEKTYHRVYSEDMGFYSNWAIDAIWIYQVVEAVDWRKLPPTRNKFLLLNYALVGYATKEMLDPFAR
ncbi:hypothetical protein K3495_g6092 [Podosphaera aphanis]|nr:hypothetical protein K3495_g6092 [Podosphaera aphanis]